MTRCTPIKWWFVNVNTLPSSFSYETNTLILLSIRHRYEQRAEQRGLQDPII